MNPGGGRLDDSAMQAAPVSRRGVEAAVGPKANCPEPIRWARWDPHVLCDARSGRWIADGDGTRCWQSGFVHTIRNDATQVKAGAAGRETGPTPLFLGDRDHGQVSPSRSESASAPTLRAPSTIAAARAGGMILRALCVRVRARITSI